MVDMLVIELPEKIRARFSPNKTEMNNLTILLSPEDMKGLINLVRHPKNKTILTYMYSFEYLDCAKITFFKDDIRFFITLYSLICLIFIVLYLKPSSTKTILQGIIIFLPLLKLCYILLTYKFWCNCPWFPTNDTVSFLRSFKVTMATFFQTMFCLGFAMMAMGYKISR